MVCHLCGPQLAAAPAAPQHVFYLSVAFMFNFATFHRPISDGGGVQKSGAHRHARRCGLCAPHRRSCAHGCQKRMPRVRQLRARPCRQRGERLCTLRGVLFQRTFHTTACFFFKTGGFPTVQHGKVPQKRWPQVHVPPSNQRWRWRAFRRATLMLHMQNRFGFAAWQIFVVLGGGLDGVRGPIWKAERLHLQRQGPAVSGGATPY